MPRFYFGVREGATVVPDEIGLEFDSLDAAERAAADTAAEIGRKCCRKAMLGRSRRGAEQTPPAGARSYRLCFPARTAFPKWQEGRHPHCHAHSLLRLHSRYGPSDCSAALQRPLSRGSGPSGCPAKPLVSYQINRQLSGWNPPPLVIRAFGAHCQLRTLPDVGMPFLLPVAGSRQVLTVRSMNYFSDCTFGS